MSAVRGSTAVLIGGFSLYHRGHHALLTRALAEAGRVVVVLGSAFGARMAKDPFTWEERAETIRLCVDAADRGRLRFAPVRDYFNDGRWSAAVEAAVAPHRASRSGVRLVLQAQDDLASHLERFPSWDQVPVDERIPVDSRQLRRIYLQAAAPDRLEPTLAVLSQWVLPPVIEFLRAWAALPFYAELAADQQAIDAERAKWKDPPYEPQFITVDSVVRAADHVLLVKRGARPNPGAWALPGGYLDPDERLLDGALRELREETHFGLHETLLRHSLQRVAVFDDPNRSQRGRTVTHAHFFDLGHIALPRVKGSDDAAAAQWLPINDLPALEDRFFEDHFHILDEFFGLT